MYLNIFARLRPRMAVLSLVSTYRGPPGQPTGQPCQVVVADRESLGVADDRVETESHVECQGIGHRVVLAPWRIRVGFVRYPCNRLIGLYRPRLSSKQKVLSLTGFLTQSPQTLRFAALKREYSLLKACRTEGSTLMLDPFLTASLHWASVPEITAH